MPPAWLAQWVAWWKCSPMAQASCSYSAPRRAHSASAWPQATVAGTQVYPSPPLSGLHRHGSLANHSSALWLWSEAFSGLWLSSGALDSENLLLKGLESSPRGGLSERHSVGLLEGAAAARLLTTVPLLSADILSIRILKARFLLESESRVFALASSQGRSFDVADVFKRFPPLAAECVWARGVCLPVCASGSLPQGWLLRGMFTWPLAPSPSRAAHWQGQGGALASFCTPASTQLPFTQGLRSRVHLRVRSPERYFPNQVSRDGRQVC